MHHIQLGLVKFAVEKDFSAFIHHKNEGRLGINARRFAYLILTGTWLDHAKILSLLSPYVEPDQKRLSTLVSTVFKEANLTDTLRQKIENIQKSLQSAPVQIAHPLAPVAQIAQPAIPTPPLKKEPTKEEALQKLLKKCPNMDMPLKLEEKLSAPKSEREYALSNELSVKSPREQLRFFEWYLHVEFMTAKAEFKHVKWGLKRFVARLIDPKIPDAIKVRTFDIDSIRWHFSTFALNVRGHCKIIQQIARKNPDDDHLQQAAETVANKLAEFERMNQRFDDVCHWVMKVARLFGHEYHRKENVAKTEKLDLDLRFLKREIAFIDFAYAYKDANGDSILEKSLAQGTSMLSKLSGRKPLDSKENQELLEIKDYFSKLSCDQPFSLDTLRGKIERAQSLISKAFEQMNEPMPETLRSLPNSVLTFWLPRVERQLND
ncbi:MAG: hypothetical protein LLG04_14285 [Parachlamydia sp.]|nr:hypothetical protein [Parachlamydia sp.]